MGQLREHNRAAALRALLDHGALSRTQLVGLLGLPQSVVSAITAELLAAGLLQNGESAALPGPAGLAAAPGVAKRGRQARPLDLVPRSRYAVGIHVGATNVDVGLVDLRAVPVVLRTLRIERDAWGNDITPFARSVGRQVRELALRAGVPVAALVGAGVGVAGWVDGERGLVRRHPRLGWRDAPVGEALSEALDLPVTVDEHVRSMALAEAWFGNGRQVNSLALLYVSTVVGCGVVFGRRVHGGHAAAAGGIGFLPSWPVDAGHGDGTGCPDSPRGTRSPSGALRSLEATVSEPAVRREALDCATCFPDSLATRWAGRSAPGQFRTSDELAASIGAGGAPDSHSLALLRRRAARLAPFVAQLLGTVAPQVFAVSGPMALDAGGLQLRLLRQEVLAHAPDIADRLPAFVPTAFGGQGALIGAASLVLQEVYSPSFGGRHGGAADGAFGEAVRQRAMDGRRDPPAAAAFQPHGVSSSPDEYNGGAQ